MDYSQIHKDYRRLHLLTQRVYISRHVLFHEHIFPFKDMPSTFISGQPTSSLSHSLTILPLNSLHIPPPSILASIVSPSPQSSSLFSLNDDQTKDKVTQIKNIFKLSFLYNLNSLY
jgi:hypothetical protein